MDNSCSKDKVLPKCNVGLACTLMYACEQINNSLIWGHGRLLACKCCMQNCSHILQLANYLLADKHNCASECQTLFG